MEFEQRGKNLWRCKEPDAEFTIKREVFVEGEGLEEIFKLRVKYRLVSGANDFVEATAGGHSSLNAAIQKAEKSLNFIRGRFLANN